VRGLPEKYRTALELVYFDGLTHAEAADVLGRPKGTVDSLVKRGLDRLRGPLTQLGPPAVVLGGLPNLDAASPRIEAALKAATGAVAAARAGWLGLWKVSAAALALAAAGVVSAVATRPAPVPSARPPKADPPAAAAALEPTLADDNLRRLNDILPRMVAALKTLAVGGGEVTVLEATAFDTRVKAYFEIRHNSPVLTNGRPTRTLFVFDTHTREAHIDSDPESNGHWRKVDPDKPIVLTLPDSLFGKRGLTLPGLTTAVAVLKELPADPRGPAESVARNQKVREAVAEYLGPWLWHGDPARPAEVRLGGSKVEVWHAWIDALAHSVEYDRIVPAAVGLRREINLHDAPSGHRMKLSPDGRRLQMFWPDDWYTRPPGWTPPARRP
jgi:hypothetical protein